MRVDFESRPEVRLIAYSQADIHLPEQYVRLISNLEKKGELELTKKVRELSHLGPTELVVYGSKSCRSKMSSNEIYMSDLLKCLREPDINFLDFSEKDFQKIRSRLDEINEYMLSLTIESGHLAVLDQASFSFSLSDISRQVTLFLCASQYASHMQQSLRAVEPEDFYIPLSILGTKFGHRLEEIYSEDLEFYRKMVKAGLPKEDARYSLPLDTVTNDQVILNARELTYLRLIPGKEWDKDNIPEAVKDVVMNMVGEAREVSPGLFNERSTTFEPLRYFPASQLFGQRNENIGKLREKNGKEDDVVLLDHSKIEIEDLEKHVTDRRLSEIANLKHTHFTFLVPESIACFHQSTRQRTWDQSVETLTQALERRQYIIPPTIANSNFAGEFEERIQKKYDLRLEMLEEGFKPSEVNGIAAHAHIVYDLIHMNGWNVLYSLQVRTCDNAQWEIRRRAQQMAREISKVYPELGRFAQPDCRRFGNCTERSPCKNKDVYLKAFKERQK